MTDVLISCMALAQLPDLFNKAPGFLQWAGQATGGHPDWQKPADSMRKGAWRKGRLLPTLLGMYGFPKDARVAAVGFSAGSNSGLRELTRNEEDRAQIDTILAVDGFHPMKHPNPKGSGAAQQFAAYDQQIAGIAEFAITAAHGGKVYAQTSSQVATPNPGVFATWEAMPLLHDLVLDQVPARLHSPAALPSGFPNRTSDPKLKTGETYPKPLAVAGNANFVQLYYPGAGKRAHQLQAWIVAHDLVRELLAPRWNTGEV